MTETLPPCPPPNVLLEISPLWPIDKVFAVTTTGPASPVLPGLVCELIPVSRLGSPDAPSIDSWPATVTETFPPLPGPNVPLEISPLLTMDKLPALTRTVPAIPVLPGLACEAIPVGGG